MKLSEREDRLLKLIPRRRPISSTELVVAFYGEEVPFDARGLINATLARIIAKLGPGAIEKSPRRGPHPVTYRRIT